MYQTEQVYSTTSNLYEVLGISKTASNTEIRRAYKRLAWKCHPDKRSGSATEFEAANKAYTVLIDRKNRILYNLFGDAILPVLLEGQYRKLVERLTSPQLTTLLLLFIPLFLLGTLFYPYVSFLAKLNYITYSATLVPLGLALLLGGLGVCMFLSLMMQSRIFWAVRGLEGTALFGLALGVTIYLDGLISRIALSCIGLGCWHIYTMGRVAEQTAKVEEAGILVIFGYALIHTVCSPNYLIDTGFMILQIGLFGLDSSDLVLIGRAVVPLMYIGVALYRNRLTSSTCILISFVWFLILIPMLLLHKVVLGTVAKSISVLFLLIKLSLVILCIITIRHKFHISYAGEFPALK
ncbi:hypothetical protein NEHOM01_0968 [Nematocida homosporus]|uniref:uncharacterized protein n=1 Tax=Nematocida homosporus TaxID=1912981 RepID=UPI00221E7B7C|nr:uncharacterized protein NEHOM01_0968 [Nematocida homosporus]KAI5185642.1 hypothetical protein NEHOM01_0968 [Nematocida homosporus]